MATLFGYICADIVTAWMLRENQQSRPNIYQVLREACAMQGREPPVKDVGFYVILMLELVADGLADILWNVSGRLSGLPRDTTNSKSPVAANRWCCLLQTASPATGYS